MRAVLTLQVPTDDWKRGRIIAATSDERTIRAFCKRLLLERELTVDAVDDPFDRELARLELDQLRARLCFAVSADGATEHAAD